MPTTTAALRRPGIVIVVFGAAVLLASAALTAMHPVGDSSIGRLQRLVSVDDEANLWAWYSTTLWLLVGVGFGRLASKEVARGRRRTYWLFSTVAVYLSLDESAALHEQLSWRLPAMQTVMGSWLIVAVPFVVVIGVALLVVARSIPPLMRRRLVLAGVVYLAGAAGAEAAGGVLTLTAGLTTTSPLYLLESHVEEALEMLGTLLTLRAVVLQLDPESPLERSHRPATTRA